MDDIFALTIPDGSVINCDYGEGTTMYKRICVEKEFDITDSNYFSHFSRHCHVEEFVVIDKDSSFFTLQGCLYKKYIPEEYNDYGDHIYYICGELPEDVKSGSILICCPQANPIKDIVLPDDCIAIAGGALYGCKLNSLYIPDSMRSTAIAAFDGLKVDTVYVPDKFGNYSPCHNDVNLDVNVVSNDPLSAGLKFEVELVWRCVLNESMWDKNTDLFGLLLPDYIKYDDDDEIY